MSEFGKYEHNDQTAFKLRVDELLKSRHKDRTEKILVTTANSTHIELTVWDISPAFDTDWQVGNWYQVKNIFVKKWNSSVELESSSDTTAAGISDPTTTRATGREGKSDGTHSESDDETGSPELQPNELADWYEALSAIHESLPSETHSRWKSAIESIIFGGNMLAPETPCYGEQQATRNSFKLDDYRNVYGDGDRVREFPAIEVSHPRVPDREHVDESFRVPITPESDTVLPILVDADALPSAIALLSEFPAAPDAELAGNIEEPLVDPGLTDASSSLGGNANTSASKPPGRATDDDETVSPNKLAELYDALYALFESIPETVHPWWSEALESVIFGGEFLRCDADSYGTQQNEYNDFSISEYRDRYGDGDHITEFQIIQTVVKPAPEDHHDAPDINCPVAPDSEVALPVAPTIDELPQALRLLNEFPVTPQAETDSIGGESLLSLESVIASLTDATEPSASSNSGPSSTAGEVSAGSEDAPTQSETDSAPPDTRINTTDTTEPRLDDADTDSEPDTSESIVLRSETVAESSVPLSQTEQAEHHQTRKYEDAAAERAHRRAQRRDPSDVVTHGEEVTLTLKEVDYSSRPPTIMGTKNSLVVFVIDAPQDLSKYDTIHAKIVDFGGKNNSAEAAFIDYVG